ncbi:MAG TPA: hypothetical protein VFR18_16275 [Terriglobia bacterium]|nr:hypothetical protein [Terriglobia bacterium]
MIKSILGVIVGYLAMLATVFITLTTSYYLLGVERTFKPDSYDVTLVWVFVMLLFSVLAAFIGGSVCRLISGKTRAMIPLAAFVLVLGLVSAVATILASEVPVTRGGDVSNQQAMMNAQLPGWAALLLPVLCAAGVVLGGRKRSES